jgi:acetylornithine deacetylase/succinyl-diaminopimelate desuccinylase-like protein
MEMIERARELAAEMRPAMIDFAQRGIRCPSLPGEERAFAQLVLKELQTLGYEATCVDDWGNVMGMVRGNAEGPAIMYNAHLDHVDVGDPTVAG